MIVPQLARTTRYPRKRTQVGHRCHEESHTPQEDKAPLTQPPHPLDATHLIVGPLPEIAHR
jgi:hypothetical protein